MKEHANKLLKKEFILFFLIFLFGEILRLYNLNYPLGLHGDEAWTGIEAKRILVDGFIGVWSPSALGQPTLPFYWTALFFKVFGENIVKLRLSFVVLQIAALPFFYLTARYFLPKKIALLSFLLYVCSPILLHFARITPTHSLFLVGFFPAVYWFLRTFQTHKIHDAVIAGILLGLTPYLYVGLRLLPIVFILFLFAKSLQKNFLKQSYRHIIIIFTIACIIFFPLGYYGFHHQEEFFTRTKMVSIFSSSGTTHEAYVTDASLVQKVRALTINTIKTVGMFVATGDPDAQDNNNRTPLFHPFISFFFFVGFIIGLWKVKSDLRIFLYVAFFLFLTGSILTIDAPNFRRTQPSIALSYFFIGLGVWSVAEYIKKKLHRQKHAFAIALILICTIIISLQLRFAVIQGASAETKQVFCYPLVRAATFLRTVPDAYVYFYSTQWSYRYETLRFLVSDIPGEDRSQEFGVASLENLHPEKTVVYLFLPNYFENVNKVQDKYPHGTIQTVKDTNGEVLFFAYIIPKKL